MYENNLKELERVMRNLLAAAVRVRGDLDNRIKRASKAGMSGPVFDGLVSLSLAICEAEKTLRAIGVERAKESQI